ncbi:MAG: Rne/Rng family ribonuclease [Caulobacteraceae bacterium]|nr:Rne/Rng family ribonuclease [Caulobacteraceae bacterium]
MTKRMLIDAAHAEETRVVVLDGSRVEDFDFESQSRKQLRGNIYLAKVTRVEPSLQAAFIEYGGNRHGFLAFNEIHPDYYQIPLADREALMREEAEEADDHHPIAAVRDDEEGLDDDDDDVIGEEAARRNRRLMRRYKIQEVIKRRQIMLVQVVKEERGNKGAALTTYLSLAGRYGVLMPNTARGGGISRKITAVTDRKRLKSVVQSLEVPQGMGLIVRTAGAKRTKAELKRDYEYLMRLWENIRDRTLHSIAPALIYEEEDLVKRAIRDMYDKDLEGIWVEGDAGFREARDFMRMIMPSQAKKIQAYRDPTPLFVQAKVEDVLAQIYSPVVPLRSGGYLVINQTEALVAIDVNSGKSTRERNIEATALKTNLEAAEEAARQLRLRDLAGLIDIDFIDMDEGKNNRAVEKKLKDALKDDRARIQMGKISAFGLMEISRQRRRTGVLEGTTHVCEHCAGTGRVRSAESAALSALRGVEMEAVRGGGGAVTLYVSHAVGLYILNEKRAYLERVRQGHGLHVVVMIDETIAQAEHRIDRTESREHDRGSAEAVAALRGGYPPLTHEEEASEMADEAVLDEEELEEELEEAEAHERSRGRAESDDSEGAGRRRRRRRRGRGRDEAPERGEAAAESVGEPSAYGDEDESEDGQGRGKRRRRGRRGGRRMREDVRRDDPYTWTRPRVPDGDPYIWMEVGQPYPQPSAEAPAPAEPVPLAAAPEAASDEAAPPATEPLAPVSAVAEEAADMWVELPEAPEPVAKPVRARRARAKKAAAVEEASADTPVQAAAEPAPEPVVAEAPAPAPQPEPEPVLEPITAASAPVLEPVFDAAEISAPPEKPKRGWWRRG